jgi:hypothetical protein
MSRRHNSSRRRQYGRRQHEVRERRTGSPVERDWAQPSHVDDWGMVDQPDDRTSTAADEYGGAQL